MNSADARDEVMKIINDAVDGLGLDIRWQGTEYLDPPAADATWLRVSMTHQDGNQGSLSCQDGKRRWNRTGLIAVQCFAPVRQAGLKVAFELACDLRDALQDYSSKTGLWFRSCSAKEVGPDGSWYQANATGIFDYDDVR